MTAYYNEFDPNAAEWLKQLIKTGEIAPGDVDTRSIIDVKAEDLKGYTQCHFFAGIGVWSAALRLAGWSDSRPVWTASCPCQGYSNAGKGGGTGDDRDLWPIFAALARERKPPIVFGEQVAAAIRYGWLDRLRTDMEAEAYAVGGVVLGAHSAGADHIRQRLWWVADSTGGQREQCIRPQGDYISGLGNNGPDCGLADMQSQGLQGMHNGCGDGTKRRRHSTGHTRPSCGEIDFNLWRDSKWHQCRDGKARRIPTEPRLFPLADARTHKGYRVAALRGAGNAINIGTAAMFIGAAMDVAQ